MNARYTRFPQWWEVRIVYGSQHDKSDVRTYLQGSCSVYHMPCERKVSVPTSSGSLNDSLQ